MLSTAVAILSAASFVLAQQDGPIAGLNPDPKDTSNPRLVGKLFTYSQIPYQVDTSNGERGQQEGYNQCNSTTAGQNSMCQTLIVNDITDFCLWGPPERGTVGDTEDHVVAWCTKPTHGARLIPPGTLTGVQYIRTPSYIEFTGFIKQENLNIPANDDGGELDSGGQDLRGNPIGAIAYSNSMPSQRGVLSQARMWHAFMGSGQFCMKFCDEKAPNASGLCRHTFDTIGCGPNVPAAYQDGVFLSCLGEDQDPVTPDNTRIPASSNCVTYQSTDLYPAAQNTATVPNPPTPSQTASAPSQTAGAPSQAPSAPAPSGPGSVSASTSATVKPQPPATTTSKTSLPTSSQTGQPGNAAISGSARLGVAAVAVLVAGVILA